MKDILLHIEALIFASEEGLTVQEIKPVLEESLAIEISTKELHALILKIQENYALQDSVFQLQQINHAYQFLTKDTYHESIRLLKAHKDKRKLSQSALETLAIIAYKQPITKLDIEQIRGVNGDYAVQKLLEKKLIKIAGKAETIGKPILYATSAQFMNYFGINSVKDLPQLKDILPAENSIGEISE